MKYVWLTAAIVVALGTAAESVQAEVWKITSLKVLGIAATTPQSAAELQVASSPAGPWTTKKYIVSNTVADGSLLRIPANTEVRLTSAQSVSAQHDYGSYGELELRASNPKRNAFAVLAGKWLFKVEQQLDSVSVSAGRGQALTRNTEFMVEADPATGNATFQVTHGSIDVVADTVVQVAQQAIASPPARKLLKAGDPPYHLFNTANDYLVNYGTFDDAISAFENNLSETIKLQDSAGQFNALIALGDILRVAGRGPEAFTKYEQAMATVPHERDGYWRAILRGRQGDALLAQNRFNEAETAYQQSIAEHTVVPFREGQDPVTDQRVNLAQAYLADGTYRCAQLQVNAVLAALDSRTHTNYSPSRAAALQASGGIAAANNRNSQAINFYTRSVALWRIIGYPKRAPSGQVISEELVNSLNGYGSALLQSGKINSALEQHREALTVANILFTDPHGLQADSKLGIAWTKAMHGNSAEALAEVDQILTLLEAAPHDVLRKGNAQQARGSFLLALGRPIEAVASLERAKEFWRSIWPNYDHPRFVELMPLLAKALRASGTSDAESRAQTAEKAGRSGAQILANREQTCLH